jgi:hypothetical protein
VGTSACGSLDALLSLVSLFVMLLLSGILRPLLRFFIPLRLHLLLLLRLHFLPLLRLHFLLLLRLGLLMFGFCFRLWSWLRLLFFLARGLFVLSAHYRGNSQYQRQHSYAGRD